MGNGLDKEVKEACQKFKVYTLKDIFNSPEGEHYDVFKIIHVEDNKEDGTPGDQLDCVSLALENRPSDLPIIPFLELFKEKIEKNKSISNKDMTFTPPQLNRQKKSYLERLVEHHCSDLESFTYLLDNSDTFPLTKAEGGECSIVLHLLSCDPRSIELLRDYLASGKVEERFKNSDNDGEKMRHSEKFHRQTPLFNACENCNAQAASELIANKIGGTNYCESLEAMIYWVAKDASTVRTESSWKKNDHYAEKQEIAAVEICSYILAQPNADKLRNHKIEYEQLLELITNERKDFLCERANNLKLEVDQTEGDYCNLLTAAWVLGLDILYEYLVKNGFKPQEKKLKSRGVYIAIKGKSSSDYDKCMKILSSQNNICVDLARSHPFRDTPIYDVYYRSDNVLQTLINAGISIDKPNPENGMSALFQLMTEKNLQYYSEAADKFISLGADINFERQTQDGGFILHRLAEIKIDDRARAFIKKYVHRNKVHVNAVNKHGRTALQVAVFNKAVGIVEMLKDITDRTIKDNDGKTVDDIALAPLRKYVEDPRDRTKVIELLGLTKEEYQRAPTFPTVTPPKAP